MVEIIGAGSPRDRASIALSTRQGTHIQNERRHEWAPATLEDSVRRWRQYRPRARLRSLTAIYNCMGMVFAARRTHIDPTQFDLIKAEDGYRRLSGAGDAEVGDLVLYRVGEPVEHVGIVVWKSPNPLRGEDDISVLSKWGSEGEYLHPIEHVPEIYGRKIEFWTDRVDRRSQ